jgi:CRISPR-associated protein (TIGR02584 family)
MWAPFGWRCGIQWGKPAATAGMSILGQISHSQWGGMRHELITVAGMTPQIVTETLWWLSRRAASPVAVQALHIATTASAEGTLKDALCGPAGALARLERDWEIPPPTVSFYIFKGADGRPLDDIRDSADSKAFSAGISELLRRLTMDPDVALHASLAGGRKTMGFHLGHIMTLFARPQDTLTHVLVQPEFEDCEDFWYPEPTSRQTTNRRGMPVDPKEAKVDVADIDFVRLRGRLSAREIAMTVSSVTPLFHAAQRAVDATGAIAETRLIVDAVLPLGVRGPLEPVLRTLERNCQLGIRISACPAGQAGVVTAVEAQVQATTPALAQVSLQKVITDLRQSVNLRQSGYRLVADDGRAPLLVSPEWTVRIVPTGQSVWVDSGPKALSAAQIGALRSLRLAFALPAASIPLLDLPVSALAGTGIQSELCWTIERVALDERELDLIAAVREKLAKAKVTAVGDWQVDARTILNSEEHDAITSRLARWIRRREGYRAAVVLRATSPLPDALVASIGRLLWRGRPFQILPGETAGDEDPEELNLADAFCPSDEGTGPPFDLPSVGELRAAGVQAAWPQAPSSLSAAGILLGRSENREIRFPPADRAQHLYVIGGSGTGKSTLLRNMILQDVEAGEGAFVLDPHGDLADDVIRHIPKARASDVILLDAGDTNHPFGLNFVQLDQDHRDMSGSFVVSELLRIFWHLYKAIPESMGPAFEQYFTVVLKLLMENDAWTKPSLLDVARVFEDGKFRSALMRGCTNRTVLDVLRLALKADGDASWQNVAPYITNKLNRLTLSPLLRNITCQTQSSVDFRVAMDQRQIVIVKLPKGRIPDIDVRLLGMLIIGKLFGAALGRADQDAIARRPMYVYIDEFQNFVTETVGQMMAEARKYGLCLTLANQNLAQIDRQLKDTVLGNSSSFLSLRVGPFDAATIEPFFEPTISARDLQALPNYHCATRILSGGTPLMPPFVMCTEPPTVTPDDAFEPTELLIAASRDRYTRPVETVETDLTARHDAYRDVALR